MQETDDHTTTLAAIKSQLRQFVRERDWEQYHFPKDLAIGLSIEAAELLEHFRFRSNDEIARHLQDKEFYRKLATNWPMSSISSSSCAINWVWMPPELCGKN